MLGPGWAGPDPARCSALRDTPTPAGGASRPHTAPKSTWRKEEAPVPLPQSRRGTDPALLWCRGAAQLLGWAWSRRPRSPPCPIARWGCQAAARGCDTPGTQVGVWQPPGPAAGPVVQESCTRAGSWQHGAHVPACTAAAGHRPTPAPIPAVTPRPSRPLSRSGCAGGDGSCAPPAALNAASCLGAGLGLHGIFV